jgi:hypothetical protein
MTTKSRLLKAFGLFIFFPPVFEMGIETRSSFHFDHEESEASLWLACSAVEGISLIERTKSY